MIKGWVNTILIFIIEVGFRIGLVCPREQQEFIFRTCVGSSASPHTVDCHRQAAPFFVAHDRPGWFQEVEIALERCNGQEHTTYVLTEPRRPGIGSIDKPVGFNRTFRCFKSDDATTSKRRTTHFSILQQTDA